MMKRKTLRSLTGFIALVAFLLSAMPAASQEASNGEAPAGQLINAEDVRASDSRVVEVEGASGGKAVTNARAWQPLVRVPVPAEGDRFTLHVRHTQGPLLLKALIDGRQVEFAQIWDRPETFTWKRVGTYSRAELGEAFLVIRGGGETDPHIDAVVITTEGAAAGGGGAVRGGAVGGGAVGGGAVVGGGDVLDLPEDALVQSEVKELPSAVPDGDATPVDVQVTIDWSIQAFEVPAMLWGVNDYEIHQPANAGDAGFNAALRRLDPPVIRIHRGTFPREWLDAEGREWDVEKITSVWRRAEGYGQIPVKITLATWPQWMCEPGERFLAREHLDAYAELCVGLMRVMRDEVGRDVAFWEVTNERDGLYGRAGRLDELWEIYNRVAEEMKRFDPEARVGGPSFTWANPQWVLPFLENCIDNADFVSYHNYGTGDIYDTNESLFSKLDTIEGHARNMRRWVDEAAGDRRIPVFLNEYNVKWTWDPFEARHANNVGAAFHAGLLGRLARQGIDGAMHWHVKGNAYGIIDARNTPRATEHLFAWGPRHLVGQAASVDVSGDGIEVLAVTGKDARRAVLLTNTTPVPARLPAASELLGRGEFVIARVEHGYTGTLDPPTGAMTLPGYSVTLLREKPDDTLYSQTPG